MLVFVFPCLETSGLLIRDKLTFHATLLTLLRPRRRFKGASCCANFGPTQLSVYPVLLRPWADMAAADAAPTALVLALTQHTPSHGQRELEGVPRCLLTSIYRSCMVSSHRHLRQAFVSSYQYILCTKRTTNPVSPPLALRAPSDGQAPCRAAGGACRTRAPLPFSTRSS